MALSILVIAVIAYALSWPNICELVTGFAFPAEGEEAAPSDYPHVLRRFRWRGVGYVLAADCIRALLCVLFGGMLLKGHGYPALGKQLALFFTLFFAVLDQSLPVIRGRSTVQNLVYPALMLLFVDWKLFLACMVLALLALALTGSRGLMVLVGAAALPLFAIIFGNWWLTVLFALVSAACLVIADPEGFRLLPEGRFGGKLRRTRRAPEADEDGDPDSETDDFR